MLFSAEVVLRGRVITYSGNAPDRESFVKVIREKVESKYPKYVEGLQIRQVRLLETV